MHESIRRPAQIENSHDIMSGCPMTACTKKSNTQTDIDELTKKQRTLREWSATKMGNSAYQMANSLASRVYVATQNISGETILKTSTLILSTPSPQKQDEAQPCRTLQARKPKIRKPLHANTLTPKPAKAPTPENERLNHKRINPKA